MFQIQVLPAGQFEPINCNVSAETIEGLTTYCSQQINCEVTLYSDNQCNQPLQPWMTLQQSGIKHGSVIFARITQAIKQASSAYVDVTCWLIVDGYEVNEGIIIRADYTFEEVLQNAIEQRSINFMPQKIKVTDIKGTLLTTLMEIQMCKLIPQGATEAEFYLHLTATGQEPKIYPITANAEQFYAPPPNQYNQQYQQQQYYQPYQQTQQIKQISSSSDSLLKQIKLTMESLVVLPFVTLVINLEGTQVSYKFHFPIIVSGYFSERMGKKKQYKPSHDWKIRNGIEYAEYNKLGFIIRWKNDTYNAMRLQLIS